MLVTEYFGLLIGLFSVAHNFWANWNIHTSRLVLRSRRQQAVDTAPQTNLVILLPMLEEQGLAAEAVEYFAKLPYPRNLYHVVVATSGRENKKHGFTTTTIVERLLGNSDLAHCSVFETNGLDTCKADQLNQALQWLDQSDLDWWTEDTVVGVYDADSRPETDSLLEVGQVAREHTEVNVFQQPALYLLGFNRLRKGVLGAYLRSRPLYNLRFCLYRELPAFLRSFSAKGQQSCGVSGLCQSPNHLLGHGEFIRLQTLRAIGGFPPPSGDTSLGTILSYRGEAIWPLSRFDIGQTPDSILMLVLQGATWYAGCSLYYRDLWRAVGVVENVRWYHVLMVLKRWQENMIWFIGPVVWIIAVMFAFANGNTWVLGLCFTGALLHGLSVGQVVFAVSELSPSLNSPALHGIPCKKEFLFPCILYPIMLLGTCAGPALHYYRWLINRVTGGPISRSKTTRIT